MNGIGPQMTRIVSGLALVLALPRRTIGNISAVEA